MRIVGTHVRKNVSSHRGIVTEVRIADRAVRVVLTDVRVGRADRRFRREDLRVRRTDRPVLRPEGLVARSPLAPRAASASRVSRHQARASCRVRILRIPQVNDALGNALRGQASTFGGEALVAAAEALRDAADKNTWPAAEATLLRVEKEIDRLLRALAAAGARRP